MAPVFVDPAKIREFVDTDTFYRWLGNNHDKADELWIKIHKVNSGLPSITAKEAIDVVLCWGWIDGIRKGFDERASSSAIRHAAAKASGAGSMSTMSHG